MDGAFNKAWIEQPVASVADIGEEEWDRIIDVDLRSILFCHEARDPADAAIGRRGDREHLLRRRCDRHPGQAASAAAKHGVIGLTKSAALDYAVGLDWTDEQFRGFVNLVESEHRVVRYDRPGAGLSDRSDPAPSSREQEVAVLAGLMDAIGLESVSLFGASSGSVVAAGCAAASRCRPADTAAPPAPRPHRAGGRTYSNCAVFPSREHA